MQIRIRSERLEKLKRILRRYSRRDLDFNEPHVTLKLDRQQIDRQEVIRNLLRPKNLVFVGVSESKNPRFEQVYDLYFRLGRSRILKVPVSTSPKRLYVITVFKIRSKIQHEAAKYK